VEVPGPESQRRPGQGWIVEKIAKVPGPELVVGRSEQDPGRGPGAGDPGYGSEGRVEQYAGIACGKMQNQKWALQVSQVPHGSTTEAIGRVAKGKG
jgi:hypothetical protein